MIILIKDFDYFSKSLYKPEEVNLTLEPIDALKVVAFCENLFRYKESYLKELSLQALSTDTKMVEFQVIVDLDIDKIILADELRLKQVLINLLSNSFKFTKVGVISLHVQSKNLLSGSFLKFTVKDTGFGIDSDLLAQINSCAPFSKGRCRSNSMGSGLGLIIVKDILMKMAKDFKIKSRLGIGTKVSFLVPNFQRANNHISYMNVTDEDDTKTVKCDLHLEKTAFLEEECRDVEMLQISEKDLMSDECYLMENHNIRPHSSPTQKILRMLVVDDEPIIRKAQVNLIKSYCKSNCIPIDVKECSDGVECLYEIYSGFSNEIKFNAIILDQCMSFLKGSTTAKIINDLIKEKTCYPIKLFLSTALCIGNSTFSTEYKAFNHVFNKPIPYSDVKTIFDEI